ncbi:MAG: hypothetical protein MUF05_00285 [Candidatus Omnitrophica bacterium]|nr:hypothetical protein [Candidatus Omnitrophota bacterium]
MDINLFLTNTQQMLAPYLEQLRLFKFSVLNPVIWAIALIVFFILSRNWNANKAFSFCIITLLILFSQTFVSDHLSSSYALVFDSSVVRIIFAVFFFIVLLYYIFIRED